MRNDGRQRREVRVLVVDDSLEFRSSLREYLQTLDAVQIVGEAGDGEQAVAESARLRPDLVLMDVRMPRCNGLEAARRIRLGQEGPRVVLFSLHADEHLRRAALDAGADDLLSKSALAASAAELLHDFTRRDDALVDDGSDGPASGFTLEWDWEKSLTPPSQVAPRAATTVLSADVAHSMRNMLQTILTHAALAQHVLRDQPTVQASLTEIARAGQRCSAFLHGRGRNRHASIPPSEPVGAQPAAPVPISPVLDVPGGRGRVLVVDDEPAIVTALSGVLQAVGFAVETATDGLQAVEHLQTRGFDVVVSDIAMPHMDGMALLHAVREQDLDVPVIFATGVQSLTTARAAVAHGALRYLQKPIDPDELIAVVERAVSLGKLGRVKREAVELLGAQGRMSGDRAGLDVTFSRAVEGIWVAYQPIVCYPERRVVAYEALLRSSEPSLSQPGSILDAAERVDRLFEVGRLVRRKVAHDIANSGVEQVFVNLHPRDLLDGELYLSDSPLSRVASKVVLELTERASLERIPNVKTCVAALRSLGYRIAVDDVGAGYAGLTSIAQVEPEVVKVDMALVRGIDLSSTKQKLVGALLRLCAEMNAFVIIEGVETPEERDTLLQLGGTYFQGHLFGRPDKPFPGAVFG